jgi:hypothetical protein
MASEVVVEQRLYVALEHLEREDDGTATASDRVEQPELDAMGLGVVVLFTEEDDVGGRSLLDQCAK